MERGTERGTWIVDRGSKPWNVERGSDLYRGRTLLKSSSKPTLVSSEATSTTEETTPTPESEVETPPPKRLKVLVGATELNFDISGGIFKPAADTEIEEATVPLVDPQVATTEVTEQQGVEALPIVATVPLVDPQVATTEVTEQQGVEALPIVATETTTPPQEEVEEEGKPPAIQEQTLVEEGKPPAIQEQTLVEEVEEEGKPPAIQDQTQPLEPTEDQNTISAIAEMFEDTTKMQCIAIEEAYDLQGLGTGGEVHSNAPQGFPAVPHDPYQNVLQGHPSAPQDPYQNLQMSRPGCASYPGRAHCPARASGQAEYWTGSSPVMEKAEYNGESLMLPKIAPRTEPNVTIRKAIFQQTTTTIENHQGGNKVNWHWRMMMLDSRLQQEVPSLVIVTKQYLPTLANENTVNVYQYSDCALHGNNVSVSLDMNDAADPNVILAASRAACRYLSMTMTLDPQQITPNGTAVNANSLPPATSMTIYMRAPQQPGTGGLHNGITRNMVLTSPDQIFRVANQPDFLVLKSGNTPLQQHYQEWIREQRCRVYFFAMKQIARTHYIGEEVATDTLNQRFQNLSQKKYNTITRKLEVKTVAEFHTDMMALVQEVENMSEDQIAQQVPELDAVFYRGLVNRIQTPELAALTQHANPSGNLAEKIDRLNVIVEAAKRVELHVEKTVAMINQAQYRRNPIQSPGSVSGRSFAGVPQDHGLVVGAGQAGASLTMSQGSVPGSSIALVPRGNRRFLLMMHLS